MEILLSVGLVLVGGVIGFFIGRHWYTRGPSQTSIEQAQNDLKAVLAQQTEHHIFQSKQVLSSIEKQCEILRGQIDSFEGLLSPEENANEDALTFFGEHTSNYLRNQLKSPSKIKPTSKTDTQPRDFADAGSGLFAGKPVEAVEKDEGTKSET